MRMFKHAFLVKFTVISLSFIFAPIIFAFDVTLYLCTNQYASCKTSACLPIPQNSNNALCTCDVKTGKSLGYQLCKPKKSLIAGYNTIIARFDPDQASNPSLLCTQPSIWANCLGSRCTVDKNNPSKAYCFCTLRPNTGNFILFNQGNNPNTCSTNIWSAISKLELESIQHLLKKQPRILN